MYNFLNSIPYYATNRGKFPAQSDESVKIHDEKSEFGCARDFYDVHCVNVCADVTAESRWSHTEAQIPWAHRK